MKRMLFCGLFMIVSVVYSQQRKARPTTHLPFFDEKPLHYGFVFADNFAGFSVKPSQYLSQITH